MSEHGQGLSDSWNERMRLIRFRRKKEKLRFREEFKLVPGWLKTVLFVLFLLAEVLALVGNFAGYREGGEIFPPELAHDPALAELALAGIVFGVSLFVSFFVLLTAYVNRDAKRRGMNSALWTFLVIVLFPGYFAVGFIIYFLMREPLPYPCPRCGSTVGPRFNFCSNCKCDLRPTCPNCKREVVETDKYCAYCGQDLKERKPMEIPEAGSGMLEGGAK